MTPHAIALVGFTSFEYSAFESFFRLARRQPGYRIVDDLNTAALILANADDLDVMRDLVAVAPRQHVLLIGASGHGTAWPVQPRPIKLMSVLTAMEQLLSPAAAEPAAPARRRAAAPPPAEEPTQPMANDDGILVVDDSETALHFMLNRLRRFGFTAELVHSGEEALKRIAQRPYKFVFLDVMMEGMDGYQACRSIKQRYYPDGKPPVVVMLTSRTGTIDKAKGKLAGCDAYLAKPLTERDLALVLTKFDVEIQRSFQTTRLDHD
jgi:two-component system cell cycle response regulator